MELTKEKYISILAEFKTENIITEDMLRLMYNYYLYVYKQKYEGRAKPTDFNNFRELYTLFVSIPVSMGSTMMEIQLNLRQQSCNKGINNTITYFNNYFSNNNSNFVLQ